MMVACRANETKGEQRSFDARQKMSGAAQSKNLDHKPRGEAKLDCHVCLFVWV